MERAKPEYDQYGQITHEPWAEDGERLDYYLARVLPDVGDQAFWYAKCDADQVKVKDKFSLNWGTFTREFWYLEWWDGEGWNHVDLATGERPRMRNGFCCIVKEDTRFDKKAPPAEPITPITRRPRPRPAPPVEADDDPMLDLPF